LLKLINSLLIAQDLKQKKNSHSQTFLKKNNKEMSFKHNKYNDQHINKHKHGKCNKEKLGCLHAESITKNVQKNQKNENIQNHERGNELKMSLRINEIGTYFIFSIIKVQL